MLVKMKKRFTYLIFLMVMLFLNCKSEKPIDSMEFVTPPPIEEPFKVTLSVVVKHDDTFSLYYSEDSTAYFTKEPIWLAVNGNENLQDIVYRLPYDAKPQLLRLDFGMNENQEDILLNSINFDYKGKSETIDLPEIGIYFRADDSKCSFDKDSGLIIANIDKGKRKFPSLYPDERTLSPLINNLSN